jgi:hypothetical protein
MNPSLLAFVRRSPDFRSFAGYCLIAGNTRLSKASFPPAMGFFRRFLLPGLATVLTGLLPAADASITASATAGSDYVRGRDDKGAVQPETYVFAEGRFFSGTTQDGSLARMKFPDITKTLAVSLAKQNYFPAANIESAQLVIMVHWGTTEIYEDPMRDINLQAAQDALSTFNAAQEAGGMADPTALNQATSALNMGQQSQMAAINRNAVLLGYARSLERERREMLTTNAEITMANELSEERYFVILMAYDNQVRLKDKKSKPLWITRLSVRSPGNNFTEALPALAKVGSEIFGQQHDDLVRVRTPLRRGSVKLGELEVLGTAPEKSPAKPGK